jgi:hypothetical protein
MDYANHSDLQYHQTARPARSRWAWGLAGLGVLLCVASCLPLNKPMILIYPTANPVLATQRHAGLFLTAARIGGHEAGPFILDTGASDVVLDAALAQKLLPGIGPTPATGRRGVVTTLEVGPLILQQIEVALKDLSAASVPFGRRLAGLLGYPFFARAVVVVDYAQGTVACFDPHTYRLPHGAWMPLTFQANRPVISARLEGNIVGQFLLDTGSNHTVLFYPDFVRTSALQGTRWTDPGKHTGVDGLRATETTRLAWFELAGVRFERPPVTFALPEHPGPPGLAGVIGSGFLQRFTVIFNYSQSQLALLPREGS